MDSEVTEPRFMCLIWGKRRITVLKICDVSRREGGAADVH